LKHSRVQACKTFGDHCRTGRCDRFRVDVLEMKAARPFCTALELALGLRAVLGLALPCAVRIRTGVHTLLVAVKLAFGFAANRLALRAVAAFTVLRWTHNSALWRFALLGALVRHNWPAGRLALGRRAHRLAHFVTFR